MPADRSSGSRSQGRRPVPTNGPGPAFWPLAPAVCVCARCAALIPATDKAQATHEAWHERDGQR